MADLGSCPSWDTQDSSWDTAGQSLDTLESSWDTPEPSWETTELSWDIPDSSWPVPETVREPPKPVFSIRDLESYWREDPVKLSEVETIWISTIEQLQTLVAKLEHRSGDIATIAFDTEGGSWRWTHAIDLLEVYDKTDNTYYKIDSLKLDKATYDTPGLNTNFTLRAWLESPDHKKIMWDARDDDQRLCSLYTISLKGVYDVSLEEAAFRATIMRDGTFRRSIMDAIDRYLQRVLKEGEVGTIWHGKYRLHSRSWTVGEVPGYCEHLEDDNELPWQRRPLCRCAEAYSMDVPCMSLLHEIFMEYFSARPKPLAAVRAWTGWELKRYDPDGGSITPWRRCRDNLEDIR